MADKEAPKGEVVELESDIQPLWIIFISIRDIRYNPVDFDH